MSKKKRLTQAQRLAATMVDIMEPISGDCLCMDEPHEDHEEELRRDYNDPSCHSQYCPRYFFAYLTAVKEGKPTPV
ncbi:hypothetical protein LCGC14_2431060 [marine sediment metagenome]|uniref:Uncharacterized protein n=1 Tax=marine sediment metagenome TaxID=412755 RepID=A0A0F9DYW8_9ZZZZ